MRDAPTPNRGEQVMMAKLKVKWVRHKSPATLLDGMDAADWSDGVKRTRAQIDALIRPLGLWGWSVKRRRGPSEIHYWHDGKRTAEQLIEFFAHELGHLSGTQLNSRRGLDEEVRADGYALAALMATKRAAKEAGLD